MTADARCRRSDSLAGALVAARGSLMPVLPMRVRTTVLTRHPHLKRERRKASRIVTVDPRR